MSCLKGCFTEDALTLNVNNRIYGLEKERGPFLAAYRFRNAAQKKHAESDFALGNIYAPGELGQNVRSAL